MAFPQNEAFVNENEHQPYCIGCERMQCAIMYVFSFSLALLCIVHTYIMFRVDLHALHCVWFYGCHFMAERMN